MQTTPGIKLTAIATLFVLHPLLPSVAAEPALINFPPSQLEWQTTPEGVAFAELVGNRFEEPYMAMVRLPAGLASPAHTKSANMFGVVVSGTMTHRAVDAGSGTGTALPEGSFYKIPRDVPHISTCTSKVDCVTFLYQDGKFDFLPVAN